MIDISIVRLGHFKQEIDMRQLNKMKSKLFRIVSCSTQPNMPNGIPYGQYWQELSDNAIFHILEPQNGSITFAITEYSLQDNFYMRHVSNGLVVISLFEIGDLLVLHNIPLENFILKNIYETISLFHYLNNRLIKTSEIIPDIIHNETRRCIFDMNALKTDIVHTLNKPSLCSQCFAKLSSKPLPDDFLENLRAELKRLRKPLFYRISDFIKCHPVWSIVIGLLTSILVNVIANFLYDLF